MAPFAYGNIIKSHVPPAEPEAWDLWAAQSGQIFFSHSTWRWLVFFTNWIPVFTGMTILVAQYFYMVILAKAGIQEISVFVLLPFCLGVRQHFKILFPYLSNFRSPPAEPEVYLWLIMAEKIYRVNMTTLMATSEDVPEKWKFLGSRGLTSRPAPGILRRTVPAAQHRVGFLRGRDWLILEYLSRYLQCFALR